ncbi:SDR family NAD(P)-dependent oxidoreductase [Actinoplanes friuliensis]|uniref:Short-chain dehydrogenase/reductase SDR n=1 Tax=Actinoplanes friuliensis DSM 7358 TaxID=1246995 RepID=U5VWY4_9ACTN|nr:SDR family oxidoreductase [Actinoplanes friuliensis]AGZ41302.1 short-chain dehydrogenase/reductase SDR [Actinoplanes friuliensis DSM 7358]
MGIAIVTGGSSGIGRATAVELAKRGEGVIFTYRGNEQAAAGLVAEIEKDGGAAVAVRLDLGDTTTFPAFVDEVRNALSSTWETDRFTSLVNNAGVGGGMTFAETTEEYFDMMSRVLFRGPFFLTQKLLPLLADGGAIVNVGSSSARSNGTERGGGYAAYAANKGAVAVLTRYLAVELAGRGIRVNTISPGTTRTGIGDNAFETYAHLIPEFGKKVLLGRIGESEDVAAAIAVLVSADGRWITGQDIEVSGGYQLGV